MQHLDALFQLIMANPVLATALGTTLAACVAFFRPIMRALQAALIRRIDQAWIDHEGVSAQEERVRKTAERVRTSTRFPLPQAYVEDKVRSRHASVRPPR